MCDVCDGARFELHVGTDGGTGTCIGFYSAKGLDKEEQKKKLTEISTHSVSAMVTTQSSFDIRFMDEDGSPLEEQYLQVDVTIVEFCDFRTVDELKHQKCVRCLRSLMLGFGQYCLVNIACARGNGRRGC